MKFGSYPQTSDNGVQSIEWQVLSREGNKVLVISLYGLDVRCFDEDSNNWANSEIRKWLNGEFYSKAFTDQEKKSIKSSNLPDVGTSDNVFLLSVREIEKYFPNNNERLCTATDYAKNNGAYVWDQNGCSYWWLRSPNPDVSSYVYYVLSDGNFDCYKYVYNDNFLVRPALWINI